MPLRSKFWDLFFPTVLSIVSILLIWRSYAPGTWLSGWDNLHPEFDLGLGFKQLFFGVWQENRGLGLLSGMSHAADLSRIVLLKLYSIFLSPINLRYAWVFLMLLIGPLGVFFTAKFLLAETKKFFLVNSSAFLAGLFYLLNLATLQYFYVPFETFVSFYGFLPWLLFTSLQYLNSGEAKSLKRVFIVGLLATSAFYVQTMFLVYAVVLAVFLLETILRKGTLGVTRGIKLLIAVTIINSFWLLPSLYFSITQGSLVSTSRINMIATPETALFNQARGGFADVALMRGFWFDYTDLKEGTVFDYLMPEVRNWALQSDVEAFGIAIFIISVTGLLGATLIKRNYFAPSCLLALLISYFMLASTNPPFGFVFELLNRKIPLLKMLFALFLQSGQLFMPCLWPWVWRIFLRFLRIRFQSIILRDT